MANDKDNNLDPLRHTAAHLLAAAVLELYPNAKPTIGPAITRGFYYDFDFGEETVGDDDLENITKKMAELLPAWETMEGRAVTATEAKEALANNPFKQELIEEIAALGEDITLYTAGGFTDLCRGGHVEVPNIAIQPGAFTLLHVAGAYWRGSEKNPMLTRIYGTVFPTKKELRVELARLAEAKKRDHKIIGPALDLFTFSELVGAGLPLWTPKGTRVRHLLDEFVSSLRGAVGFEPVEIPHITKKELYEKSGHWDKFSDELFKIITREGHEFAIKPMNCPHHTQIYARRQWSYRELPQRYSNSTMVYRDEQSGELAGLVRVRAITQDDSHVFCRTEQIQEEVMKIWDVVDAFYAGVGFSNLEIRISVHDENNMDAYLGDVATWERMVSSLTNIAQERGIENPTIDVGEAAFYGPKVDFITHDSLDREWQVATIQLDMNLPERFDLTCINEEGEKERIVMIHNAVMGSFERFLANLIEHTAGDFPVWLAPVQVALLPVSDAHLAKAEKMATVLISDGIRVEISQPTESLGKRIRESELMKIPYMAVVGDKEDDHHVTVRQRGIEEQRELSLTALGTEIAEQKPF